MAIYTAEEINEMIEAKKEEYQKMKLAGDLSGQNIQDFLTKDLNHLYLLRKQFTDKQSQ